MITALKAEDRKAGQPCVKHRHQYITSELPLPVCLFLGTEFFHARARILPIAIGGIGQHDHSGCRTGLHFINIRVARHGCGFIKEKRSLEIIEVIAQPSKTILYCFPLPAGGFPYHHRSLACTSRIASTCGKPCSFRFRIVAALSVSLRLVI